MPPSAASARAHQLWNRSKLTGIDFKHLSNPQAKFIAASMSGCVVLIDCDRDGWPDIYFTNASSVEMALHGMRARGALYHNNHDGTLQHRARLTAPGYVL